MRIEMGDIQGRLLLQESGFLYKKYHNSAFIDGNGRYGPEFSWWSAGEGSYLEYCYSDKYIKYDFNMIYETI